MIIQVLLDLIYNVFSILTTLINIPTLPDQVSSALSSSLEYLSMGVQLLANYIDISLAMVLFGVIIGIDVGLSIYHFVMWVIKKIPMLGIE